METKLFEPLTWLEAAIFFSFAAATLPEKRDEMAAAYLAQLLGIMGVQVTLGGITLASFAVSNDPPNIGVLLATTTLSIALAQSFILNVCLKDASSLEPSRIATMNLYPTEWAAFLFVTLFSISTPHRGLQPRAE